MPPPCSTARPVIRADARGEPKWNAKWSRGGRQVWRTIGPAWMEPDGAGGWRRRKGRPAAGHLTEPEAVAATLALITEHNAEQTRLERDAEERRRRGATVREVAAEWLEHLERVKGAKPSTLVDYRSILAEPGMPHRRGGERTHGRLMSAFGDHPIREIDVREVDGSYASSTAPASLRETSTSIARCCPRSSTAPAARRPMRSPRIPLRARTSAVKLRPPRSTCASRKRSKRSRAPRLAAATGDPSPRTFPKTRLGSPQRKCPGGRALPRARVHRVPARRGRRIALGRRRLQRSAAHRPARPLRRDRDDDERPSRAARRGSRRPPAAKRSLGSRHATTSPAATNTSSATAWVDGWTRRPSGAGSNEPPRRRASVRSSSTV